MKFLAVILVLAVASSIGEAKTLREAFQELQTALGLNTWIAHWTVERNGDSAVCAYSNELNGGAFATAINHIDNEPLYMDLERRLVAGGVQWQQFVDNEMLPALGWHSVIASCTTNIRGGVPQLNQNIRTAFNEPLVKATVERLLVESAEFKELHDDVSAEQAGVKAIRCHPNVQAVYDIKARNGVDFLFVYEVLGAIFGWPNITDC